MASHASRLLKDSTNVVIITGLARMRRHRLAVVWGPHRNSLSRASIASFTYEDKSKEKIITAT
jgi:hypothetical protein